MLRATPQLDKRLSQKKPHSFHDERLNAFPIRKNKTMMSALTTFIDRV